VVGESLGIEMTLRYWLQYDSRLCEGGELLDSILAR